MLELRDSLRAVCIQHTRRGIIQHVVYVEVYSGTCSVHTTFMDLLYSALQDLIDDATEGYAATCNM